MYSESAPGPASRRRRTQRLRALQQSWESDMSRRTSVGTWPAQRMESQGTAIDTDGDERPLVPPTDVVEGLERDLQNAPAIAEHGVPFAISFRSSGTVVSLLNLCPHINVWNKSDHVHKCFPKNALVEHCWTFDTVLRNLWKKQLHNLLVFPLLHSFTRDRTTVLDLEQRWVLLAQPLSTSERHVENGEELLSAPTCVQKLLSTAGENLASLFMHGGSLVHVFMALTLLSRRSLHEV